MDLGPVNHNKVTTRGENVGKIQENLKLFNSRKLKVEWNEEIVAVHSNDPCNFNELTTIDMAQVVFVFDIHVSKETLATLLPFYGSSGYCF